MKIYFNDLLTEKNRIVDDKWVKGNTGNKLEVYFDDLDLTNSAINVRGVIQWADGSTTNELVLSKSIDRKYVYLYLPQLKTDGEIKFTLRIYTNDSLLQTTIFQRKVYNSINASDDIHITSSEYESLLEAIESSGVDISDQVFKNKNDIISLKEIFEKSGIKYVDKLFTDDELLELFNIYGNGKYFIKTSTYGDEIVIVNVENNLLRRYNGKEIASYNFEENIWEKTEGSSFPENAEKTSNKIDNWDDLNNNNQYPNAQLVKSSLDNLDEKLGDKVDFKQGNSNAFKVAITNRYGYVTFYDTLPANNLPEIPKEKLPEITVDMLPSGAGIISEIAEKLQTSEGVISGDEVLEIKNKVKNIDDNLTVEVECSHKIELTGNSNDEHGLAIEDQQVLIKKIQGQTLAVGEDFVNAKNNIISTGKNLFDEEVEYGSINSTGDLVSGTTTIRAKNYNPIVGGKQYFFQTSYAGQETTMAFFFYDENKTFISRAYVKIRGTFTAPANTKYFKIGITADYGTIYNNDVCINVSDTSFNGTYEPYKKDTFVVNVELGRYDYISEEDKVYKSTSKLYTLKGTTDSGSWDIYRTTDGSANDKYPNVYRFIYTFENNENPLLTDVNGRGEGYSPTFEWTQVSGFAGLTENSICFTQGNNNQINLLVKKSLLPYYSTSALFTYLASNPVMFCFKLANEQITKVNIPSGYAVYKNGIQYQDGEVPYILTKQYALNTKAQVLANSEIDREQQSQIEDLKLFNENVNEQFNSVNEKNAEQDLSLNTFNDFIDWIIPVVDAKADSETLNNFVNKSNFEKGIINVTQEEGFEIELDLSLYSYWKGLIENIKVDSITISGLYLTSNGEEQDFEVNVTGANIEWINGALMIQEPSGKYYSFVLPSQESYLYFSADGTNSSDGFSIFWKGEK